MSEMLRQAVDRVLLDPRWRDDADGEWLERELSLAVRADAEQDADR